MGAHRYCYFTPYQADANAALHALRQAEFMAGRYDPAMTMLTFRFPPGSQSPAPGPVHGDIGEVMQDMTESGTGSILDIMWISQRPEMCAATPLSDDELQRVLGTTKPSRAEVEAVIIRPDMATMQRTEPVFQAIRRGEARYLTVYDAGEPAEIFFVGYSID